MPSSVVTSKGQITIPKAVRDAADPVTGAVQAFDSPNAGSRTLSVTAYTVNDDNGGANYTVDDTGTAAGTIDPKNLTIDGAVADNKTYDGTTSSAATEDSVTRPPTARGGSPAAPLSR